MKKSSASDASKGRRRQLTVIDSRGTPQRFLRGMITHDLVQRGLPFDDAYAVAQSIRGQLAEREEVSTSEIRDRLQETVEGMFGPDVLMAIPTVPMLQRNVLSQGERQPFSRGLLARSIQAAGIDIDRAYYLVTQLEQQLTEEGLEEIRKEEIARRVAEILERFEGVSEAQRYRLMRRIQRLPRPLVIYIGGASGTGKSTLGLDLAPLLRIYRITATDTVRQMMRMVFSPQIMPELHVSSFEPQLSSKELDLASSRLSEEEMQARIVESFQEQSTRVCVGVRAVVERAVAEGMSLLVEGVHLYPPLVPFGDLDGATYQVALMLTTSDVEVHRQRFLKRSWESGGGRRAERYIESFKAIRNLQDFLLQSAENHDIPLVDTAASQSVERQGLRWITEILQRRIPDLARVDWQSKPVPSLLLIIDGLADRPVRALGGRTPLQAAVTPTLDRLAREGQNGLADPVAPGVVPDTAAGSLALFGQSPLALKRGPVEALGAGLDLQPGDIALRANFATVDDHGRIIDRRAGRIREGTEELAKALDRLTLAGHGEVEIRVKAATEHRLAVVLRGPGLSSEIVGSDPGDGARPGPPITPHASDVKDARASETARILALFEQRAREILAAHPVNRERRKRQLPMANAVLTRGAGQIHRLLPLEQAGIPLRLSCISGDQTLLGLASWLGARALTDDAMTANLDTDLKLKMEFALEALQKDDLVVLHVKGADIAAHDQRPELKVKFLERVDHMMRKLIKHHEAPLRLAVASDHATLSENGQHAADPLPVILWGEGIEADGVTVYDEVSASGGSLGRFPLQTLLARLLNIT